MPPSPFKPLALAAALLSPACASAPTAAGTSMEATPTTSSYMQPVKEWPLRFDTHTFSAYTYDTWGAKLVYAGRLQLDEPDDVLQRPSASYGPNWQRGWAGTHLMIRNFPPPAQLEWRSKDGTRHRAEIDMREIFGDEVVRHTVARDEMAPLPDGEYRHDPAIILEVNDRTVRVYMQAYVALREQVEINGVMRYRSRREPVLVRTYTF